MSYTVYWLMHCKVRGSNPGQASSVKPHTGTLFKMWRYYYYLHYYLLGMIQTGSLASHREWPSPSSVCPRDHE